MSDLNTYSAQLDGVNGQLNATIASPKYQTIKANVQLAKDSVVQFQGSIATNKEDIKSLRNQLKADRDSMVQSLAKLISDVQRDVSSAQQNLNGALQSYANVAQSQLQSAASSVYTTVTQADAKNQDNLRQFNTDTANAFSDPENRISTISYRLGNDSATLQSAIDQAQANATKIGNDFSVLQGKAIDVAKTVVNNQADGDLRKIVNTLVDTFNSTLVQPAMRTLGRKYDDLLNNPSNGLLVTLADYKDDEQQKLSVLAAEFSGNESSLRTDSSELAHLPSKLFSDVKSNLTGQEAALRTTENEFHNALTTALSTAQRTYTATDAQATAARTAADDKWNAIKNFLTSSSSDMSSTVIEELAKMEADAGIQMMQSGTSGNQAAQNIAATGNSNQQLLTGTAQTANDLMGQSQSSAMTQMESVKKLMSMDSASLNATMQLLVDFLNKRGDGLQSNFAGALSDLAGTLGSVNSEVQTMTSSTQGEMIEMSGSEAEKAKAEIAAMAAAQNLSAENVAALYKAVDDGNTAQFKTLMTQLASQQGLALELNGDVADIASQLSSALKGSKGIADDVLEGVNVSTAVASTKIAALRGTLSATAQAAQRAISDTAKSQASALDSLTTQTVADLRDATTTAQGGLSGQQNDFDQLVPALGQTADDIQAQQGAWISAISQSESHANSDATVQLNDFDAKAKAMGGAFGDTLDGLLSDAERAVNADAAARSSTLKTTVINPRSDSLLSLAGQAAYNVSKLTTTLTEVQGVIKNLETAAGMISGDAIAKFQALVGKYESANETHKSNVQTVQQAIDTGFADESEKIEQWGNDLEGDLETIHSESQRAVAGAADSLGQVAGQGGVILSNLVRDIEYFRGNDSEKQLEAHKDELKSMADVDTLLQQSVIDITDKLDATSQVFNMSNKQMMGVIASLGSVLENAQIAGYNATAKVSALANKLGMTTAGVADRLEQSILDASQNASSYNEAVQAGAAANLASGAGAIQDTASSLSGAASAASSAAASKAEDLVNQLKNTGEQYDSVADDAVSVLNPSKAGVEARIKVFMAKQQGLQQVLTTQQMANMDEVAQVQAVVDKWQSLADSAMNATNFGVMDVGNLSTAVASDISDEVQAITQEINATTTAATADAAAASALVAAKQESKGPLLTAAGQKFSQILTDETGLYAQVRNAKNKAVLDITNMKNTEDSDTTISDAFSDWLSDYTSAFNSDVLTAIR